VSRIDRVKPVTRYRAAKYPSHADPDPTTYPAPVAFPFQREMVRAVAGFGLAASLFGCERRPEFTNPQNPFVRANGLPHRTSPFGNGQPSFEIDAVARDVIAKVFKDTSGFKKVIDKVFKDEGFTLERILYDKGGVTFRPSGFDPQRRIGYVFGDEATLGDDAIVKFAWMPSFEASSYQIEAGRELENGRPIPEPKEPGAIRRWLAISKDMIQLVSPELQKEAARIQALPDGPEMVATLGKFFKAFHAQFLSMEEIRKLEEEAPKEKEFIAVISRFDVRHDVARRLFAEKTALREHFEKEREAKTSEERIKMREERMKRYELAVREMLETLERNVREYIAWARTQGLQ
jgi:hypothetical protein